MVAIFMHLLSTAHAGSRLFHAYDVQCDAEFPCWDDLKPRVALWMNVYLNFTSRQAFFFDSEDPTFIYSVVETSDPCSHRGLGRGALRAESERIQKLLEGIRDDGRPSEPSGPAVAAATPNEPDVRPLYEGEIRALFDGPTSEDLDDAPENVGCQKGNSDMFLAAFKRYAAYQPMVTETLREAGLSTDFQYLPFSESSYDPRAVSRVGAVGLWQLMKQAAVRTGLRVSWDIDERLDPVASTRAAARFIKIVYSMIRDAVGDDRSVALAPFVLTSYNYGPGGVVRAIGKHGPDYMEILDNYKARKFGYAVKNFYASFLAAREIVRNAPKYGLPALENLPAVPAYDEIPLPVNATIEQILGKLQGAVSIDQLRPLNLSVRNVMWNPENKFPLPAGFRLRLPRTGSDWGTLLAGLTDEPREEMLAVVQRGDNLWVLARRYGVSVQALISANNLPHTRLRVGQKLVIPPGRPRQDLTAVSVDPS